MSKNPFPGPAPYDVEDRAIFAGRGDLVSRLREGIIGQRCITVHGPAGAGKSSLMQAGAIASLLESHDFRVVDVSRWPAGEDPTRRLTSAIHEELRLSSGPSDLPGAEALAMAGQRAAKRSSRPFLLHLDHVEELLDRDRDAAPVDAFFEALHGLVDMPLRDLHAALTLREDALGLFQERVRGYPRLLDRGFRVPRLTVGEVSAIACQAAARGEPPQAWALPELRARMLEVRLPGEPESDDAEVSATEAQIACRALFQQRMAPAR